MAKKSIDSARKIEIFARAEDFRERFCFPSERICMIELIDYKIPSIDESFDCEVCDHDTWEGAENEEAYCSLKPSPVLYIMQNIYRGANMGDGSCRYTIAHELGHFVLHGSIAKSRKLPERLARHVPGLSQKFHSTRTEEQEANAFAACLLTPVSHIEPSTSAWDLQLRYGVSREVAEKTLRDAAIFGKSVRTYRKRSRN